jgi:hypothetical protein
MKDLIYEQEEDSQPYLMQLPKIAVQSMDDHMDEDKFARKISAAYEIFAE